MRNSSVGTFLLERLARLSVIVVLMVEISSHLLMVVSVPRQAAHGMEEFLGRFFVV